MAVITLEQLRQASDRAAAHSLSSADVALQTSDVMPEGLEIDGAVVETAGSEKHGVIHSYTRAEVTAALEALTEAAAEAEKPKKPKASQKDEPS